MKQTHLTPFQTNFLKRFATASTELHYSELLDSKNRPYVFVTSGKFFTKKRDYYFPNMKNPLIADYFLNAPKKVKTEWVPEKPLRTFKQKFVNVESPEMLKPVLDLKANDVVVKHEEPIKYNMDGYRPVKEVPICDGKLKIGKRVLEFTDRPELREIQKYGYCFIGFLKSNPTKSKRLEFAEKLVSLFPISDSIEFMESIKINQLKAA